MSERPTKTKEPTHKAPLLYFAPSPNLPLPSLSPLPSPARPPSVHEDQEAASGPASRLPAALRSARATATAGRVGGSPGPPRRGQERGGGVALAPERCRGSRGRPLLGGEAPGIAAIAAAGTGADSSMFWILICVLIPTRGNSLARFCWESCLLLHLSGWPPRSS